MEKLDFGGKLLIMRKKKRLSQDELGAEVGVSGAQIGHYEKNKNFPSQEILGKLANALSISVSELYAEGQNIANNLMSDVKRIPFYDVDAAGGINGGDVSQSGRITGTIDIGDILRDSEAAMRVAGNSMINGYPPGCVVGLIKRYNSNIEPGEVYVYETRDDRKIKRLFHKDDDPSSQTFICYSDNDMKYDKGPRMGKYCYPPYELEKSEIINLFTVVGVIKRNTNGIINYKDQN